MGGQKSLRSYWRNYFESTDGLIWVVDSADRQRMQDCQRELQSLLVEEVRPGLLPAACAVIRQDSEAGDPSLGPGQRLDSCLFGFTLHHPEFQSHDCRSCLKTRAGAKLREPVKLA